MGIRKSKTNNAPNPQEEPEKVSFEDMMKEADNEIEEQQIEESIVDKLSELRTLNQKIEKATEALESANLALQHANQLHQQTLSQLKTEVDGIKTKVDSINTHIDNLVKEAPTKLKISVRASDADYQKMNAIIEKHRNWVIEKVQWACGDFRQLLTNEWKKTRDRYKEYDGTYLGHYTQYIFWFFCIFGIFIFLLVIFLSLDAHYHWTK